MTNTSVILALVIIAALGFDFTNGFHDTANSMATCIATGALRPKVAVLLSGFLDLVGAFLSVQVALTVTNAVVKIQNANGTPRAELLTNGGYDLLLIVLAGLIGGIAWNLLTWLFGLPSSSSHALFGGLIGATIAGFGTAGVNWSGNGTKLDGVVGKVILPAVLSPAIAGIVSTVGTMLIYRVTAGAAKRVTERGFKWGQVGSASLVALAHGTNDAQKTMGVITLALIATGDWTNTHDIPLWVKVACAFTIASGTYLGGWRIIRTLGKGLADIEPPQGLAAQSASAAVILSSSQLGFALSTTHVATGSIIGAGLGRRGAQVRWAIAGRMVAAWLITLPASAVVGAAMWWTADTIGGLAGPLVVFGILVLVTAAVYLHSRRTPVNDSNVNDEWDEASAGVGSRPTASSATGAVTAPSATGVVSALSSSPVAADLPTTVPAGPAALADPAAAVG